MGDETFESYPTDFQSWLARTPSQDHLDQALERAYENLQEQSEEQLVFLGAVPIPSGWQLPVLNDGFELFPESRRIFTVAGQPVSPIWQLLALHYLTIRERPKKLPPEVTFADLPGARTYAGVYQQRTVGRLCASVGQSKATLFGAALSLGGQVVLGGDLAFEFEVFPRITIRLIWYASDEEFSPHATLLLPPNIEQYFCSEDIVVLSERLVARLCGRPF